MLLQFKILPLLVFLFLILLILQENLQDTEKLLLSAKRLQVTHLLKYTDVD